MELEQILRRRRKALVLAAESVAHEARDGFPKKSQLNRLVSVCGEATCAEEIGNYLRYQASRSRKGNASLQPEFVKLVISKIASELKDLDNELSRSPEGERDRASVAAWRLYAVYLVRALTYVVATREEGRP